MLSMNDSQTPERHLTCVLHIISWVSFVTGLTLVGCRPVKHFSYYMNKHRPDVSVEKVGNYTLILFVSLFIWFLEMSAVA